jgi:adenosylmethionine-8-amino-7-oxononanoate aminotransferase
MIDLTLKTTNNIKISKTEGYWIYDEDGKKYLDITSGGSTFTLGYGNKRIAKSVYDSLISVTRCHSPLGYKHNLIDEVSDFICKSGGWSGFVWSITGTGAVEAAISIADEYWKLLGENKTYIIAFRKGWHGTSSLTKTLSGLNSEVGNRTILIDSPIWTDYGNQEEKEKQTLKDLRNNLYKNKKVGIVLINPSPWFNGVNVWSHYFLKELDQLRKKFKFLLISDDIASCWGRSKAFHSHTTIFPVGIKPDISCLGKAITAGYAPLSVTVVNNKVKTVVKNRVYYGHTFQPYMAGIAAMKTTTDIILEENLLEKSQTTENKLSEIGDRLIKTGLIKSYRAFGLNIAYDIDPNINNEEFTNLKKRTYGASGKYSDLSVLRITAPLNADEEYFGHLEGLLLDSLK